MNFSLKIARVFGIEVRVHWTLFVLAFALVLLRVPHSLVDVLWSCALIATVFGSVLLHEFGHSFAARFCDGHSDRIVLWPLGGLAFVNLPESPVAHFLTAVAGPLVTAAIWTIAHFTAPLLTANPPLYDCVSLIAKLNGGLLLFNLIPAFPLDGGRMLQAVLWRQLGYSRSMWISAHVAIGFALLMVASAVTVFVTNSGPLDVMLIAIAIFIFTTAWRERQMLKMEMDNSEFWDSRPGVAWNHPYRSYKDGGESRTKQKNFLAKLSVRSKPADADEELDAEHYISKEVDPILDKISREGMQSLTAREKRILEKARQKMDKKS